MENVEAKVITVLIKKFQTPEHLLTFDADLKNDLALDSLDIMELIVELENLFGITFSDDEALTVNTLGEVIRFIERQLKDR